MPDFFNILDRLPPLTYTIVAPTDLKGGWLNFGGVWATVGYTKDSQNVVHVKGLIRDGNTVDNTVIFTLPVGYWPLERMIFRVAAFDTVSGLRIGRIDIDVDGTVKIRNTLANDWLSIDGISFVAAPV